LRPENSKINQQSDDLGEETKELSPKISESIPESFDDKNDFVLNQKASNKMQVSESFIEDINLLNSEEISNSEKSQQSNIVSKIQDSIESSISNQNINIEIQTISEKINELEESESTICDRIKLNEDKKKSSATKLNDLHLQTDELQLKIEELVSVREDLNQWREARQKSFAWRLIESLNKYEKTLAIDELTVKTFSENAPEIDINFTSKIRKWILRSIGLGLFLMLGLGYLVEMLRKYSDLVSVSDPTNPANSIQVNSFDFELNNRLGLDHIQLQFIFFSIFVIYIFGIFLTYSRKTSEFRQIVAIESHKTKIMEKEIHAIKNARERIDSLHPQVPQILELLSLGLHKPWVISDKYQNFKGDLPDASKIPECLDIAVPTERSTNKIFSKLVLQALNQLQIPGWREKAFQNSIQGLAQMAGFGDSDTALKEIDQDQRRSGKRQLLINLENKESVLISIGDKLVAEFAAEVQEKVLPFSHPEVMSLRPDELAGLSLADSLVKIEDENVSQWEVKLAEIAGASAPWAPATYSSRGQISAKHEVKPESVLIATDRVCQYANKEVGQFSEIYPGTRPFEVSIRVDLSPWCHPEEIAIFQDYQPTSEELQIRSQRELAQSPKSLEINQNLDEVAF
jgi:hypothetical protein